MNANTLKTAHHVNRFFLSYTYVGFKNILTPMGACGEFRMVLF